MRSILEVLGLVLIVLVVLGGIGAVVAWFRARRAFRLIGEALRQLALRGHPSRITVRRVGRIPRWRNRDGVGDLAAALSRLGFEENGYFVVSEIPSLSLAVYLHPKERAWGVIYDHPRGGVAGPDDAVPGPLAADAFEHQPVKTPAEVPGLQMRYVPGAEPDELMERFRALVAGRTPLPPVRKGAAEMLEDAYALALGWRLRPGGPTEQALQNVVDRAGVAMAGSPLGEARPTLSGDELEDLEAALRIAFLKESRLEAAVWERIRQSVLIVHDAMTIEHLEALVVVEIGDEGRDRQVERIFPEDELPRVAFKTFNDALPEDLEFPQAGNGRVPHSGGHLRDAGRDGDDSRRFAFSVGEGASSRP